MDLAEEWDEDIPPMTVLVFYKNGNMSPRGCAYYANAETQPTPEQIAEEKESVDMYENWDRVLNAFKADIPDTK